MWDFYSLTQEIAPQIPLWSVTEQEAEREGLF